MTSSSCRWTVQASAASMILSFLCRKECQLSELTAAGSLQVKVWGLDGAELQPFSSREDASVVLGILGESVVFLCDKSWVHISHPVDRTRSTKTRLEDSERRVTVVTSVTSPRRGKVLVVSEEGFLYQVGQWGHLQRSDKQKHETETSLTFLNK